MAKLNGKKITIATVVTILMAAAGIIWGFSRQSTQLEDVREDVTRIEPEVHTNTQTIIRHEEKVTENGKDIEVMEPKVDENTKGRIAVQADITYIQGAIERTERTQQQILTELRNK